MSHSPLTPLDVMLMVIKQRPLIQCHSLEDSKPRIAVPVQHPVSWDTGAVLASPGVNTLQANTSERRARHTDI